MKPILTLLIFLLAGMVLKAQSVKLFHERGEQNIVLYANNIAVCPVSVSINLMTENLTFSEGQQRVFVIPAQSERYKLGEFSITVRGQKSSINYKYKPALGDVTNIKADTSFVYDLPFRKGSAHKLNQGYNGAFSHQNENSLDFTMPIGTDIVAARAGIVVQLVQSNTESCPEKDCEKFNNYLTIMHSDGTFASYTHIQANSSQLKVGSKVKQGDVIARSGNVGRANGPHLHFVVFIDGFTAKTTLETKFRINAGTEAVFLKEGEMYGREY